MGNPVKLAFHMKEEDRVLYGDRPVDLAIVSGLGIKTPTFLAIPVNCNMSITDLQKNVGPVWLASIWGGEFENRLMTLWTESGAAPTLTGFGFCPSGTSINTNKHIDSILSMYPEDPKSILIALLKYTIGIIRVAKEDMLESALHAITNELKNAQVTQLVQLPSSVIRNLIIKMSYNAISPVSSLWYYMTKASEASSRPMMLQQAVFRIKDNIAGRAYYPNPLNGETAVAGLFTGYGQGMDVVMGDVVSEGLSSRAEYAEVNEICKKIYGQLKCPFYIDFVFAGKHCYVTNVERSARSASVHIQEIIAQVDEENISLVDAVNAVDMQHLMAAIASSPDLTNPPPAIGAGVGTSHGIAVGVMTDNPATLSANTPYVLIKPMTKPEDLEIMQKAVAIVTTTGGPTSHAAVIAKQLGKPCVVSFKAPPGYIGKTVSVDGESGIVYDGEIPVIPGSLEDSPEFQRILEMTRYIDDVMQVYANADTPQQAELALKNGAQGIGLLRTEHMFTGENTKLFWEYLVAKTNKTKELALNAMRVMQVQNFMAIFTIMKGLPVAVRLLDPPLHEFIPDNLPEMIKSAESPTDKTLYKQLKSVSENLHEANPMLGLRGVRLGIAQPELYRMQMEAIVEAYKLVLANENQPSYITVIIPMVTYKTEMNLMFGILSDVLASAGLEAMSMSKPGPIRIGAMIETPRVAFMTASISGVCHSIHYGTNDLTQMALGMSRDDSESFLSLYEELGLTMGNPFVTLDPIVSELIGIAQSGTANGFPSGVCGEHAADPESVAEFHRQNVGYISVSPASIPVALLASGKIAATVLLNKWDNKEEDDAEAPVAT